MPNPGYRGLMSALMRMAERKVDAIEETGHEATALADENFPGQSWDFSQKNSFRHALGTGLLTKELGGGPVAKQMAKLIGYLWEARGFVPEEGMSLGERLTDTKQDLNANAIGADEATKAPDKEALIAALLKLAQESKISRAPGVLEPSPGYMTHTKE